MICGSFNLSDTGNGLTDWPDRRHDEGDLTFHPVSQERFSGGYYLHPRLPLIGDDFFYHEEGEDLFVLFSGYIYNKKELAQLFGFSEYEPEPRIAARLFRVEGPEFVRRLNGDFVIFIGQPARRRTYLLRDQVGIRPVAYSTDSGRLMFSSDITDLCRRISGKTTPVREYLLGYFKYVDLTITPSERVKRLLPGHYLEYSDKGTSLTRYWKPEKTKTDHCLNYEVMLLDLKLLVEDAVAKVRQPFHCRSSRK